MKQLLYLLTTLLFFCNSITAQEWETVQLNDFATIDFPLEPEKEVRLDIQLDYFTEDTVGSYIVAIYSEAERDYDFTEAQLPEYYAENIKEWFSVSSFKQVNQEEFEVNGLKGIEVHCYDQTKTPTDELYFRILFVNDYFIGLVFDPGNVSQETKLLTKERFFNSLSISIKDPKQYTITEDEQECRKYYVIGQIIGVATFVGAIIGFVILIWWVVKRLRNKNS